MLILLVGKIASGKTTAANILKKYEFIEDTFAKPLKDFAVSIGFTYEQVYGTQAQKLEINEHYGISGREFLQSFGTKLCRDGIPTALPNMRLDNLTLWAKALSIRVKHKLLAGKHICVSDGRFEDEANLIKSLDGVVVRIVRNLESIEEKNNDYKGHISETQMEQILADHTIHNNGTKEELEEQLVMIIKNLM
jgi:hypothetical protein